MKHVRRPAHARRTPTSHALPEAPRRTPARMAVAGVAAVGITVASTLALMPMANAGTDVSGRVIVAYEDGAKAGVLRAIEASGGKVAHTFDNIDVAVADIPAGISRALDRAPGVKYVEADHSRAATLTPNDPYYPKTGPIPGGEWGLWRTKTDQAWDKTGFGSSAVKIAVVDSGVAASHPDLVGQVLTGRNVLTGGTDTNDTDGHGTYIAGLAAAAPNNGTGVAGVCGGCRVLPVKVTTGGSVADSALASGITWAADNGARIINVSFAGTATSSTLQNAVAYARTKGSLVVVAAGNNGNNVPTFPAAYDGAVAVAATSSGSGDPLQGYSDFGPWVDIAAPAGLPTTSLTGYTAVGGTSLAAPFVAGVAGLLLTADPTLTAAMLEQAVKVGADPVLGQTDFGRVDALDAVAGVLGIASTTPSPTASSSSAAPTATVSPAPTATATSSPTATASPSPTATATTAAPSPIATATTTTFSGSLNAKKTKVTYSVSAASAGSLSTALSFGCPSLAIGFADSTGAALGSSNGGSVLRSSLPVQAGKVLITVSGSSKCSFTLTVTAP